MSRRLFGAVAAAGIILVSWGALGQSRSSRVPAVGKPANLMASVFRPGITPAPKGSAGKYELRHLRFQDSFDQERPLLLDREIHSLSIAKGTLSEEERREIESHVEHTYRFLSQIPWTRTLRRVPEIAYAHHEKLDGTGYPRAIPDTTIPVQSRMMSIADIYDALTASDRPYKKAVPHQLALDILKREAQSGQLDLELFRIFVEAEVPKRALKDFRG